MQLSAVLPLSEQATSGWGLYVDDLRMLGEDSAVSYAVTVTDSSFPLRHVLTCIADTDA